MFIFYISFNRAPINSKEARKFLTGFATSYLSERAFSLVNHLKSKKRNRLDVQHMLRVRLSGYHPNFDELINKSKGRRSRIIDSSDESESAGSVDSNRFKLVSFIKLIKKFFSFHKIEQKYRFFVSQVVSQLES